MERWDLFHKVVPAVVLTVNGVDKRIDTIMEQVEQLFIALRKNIKIRVL